MGECNLSVLSFTGVPFTWTTSRHGGIKEWLDRVLTIDTWKALYPNYYVIHLDPSKFDHTPIILSNQRLPSLGNRRHHHLRFKELWTGHEECLGIMKEAWEPPMV
ncbi:hypothetical protein ACFX15_012825 [Malus domestica]